MRLAVSLLCLVCAVCALLAVPMDGRAGARAVDPGVPELREQAQKVGDLAWVDPSGVTVRSTGTALTRGDILRERARRSWAGDHVGVARLNAIFAAEGFRRSRLVLDRTIQKLPDPTLCCTAA